MNAFKLLTAFCFLLLLTACRRDMFNQPKANPLRESDAFPDHMAARPVVPHTVAREQPDDYASGYGAGGTNWQASLPWPLTRELLERGRARHDINCAPCHGLTGEGDGMIVQRGFPRPPSYHIERLRTAPLGYFFKVITQGYGVMYPQAAQITPEDRWAIAAYVRTLQFSQHATLADVPAGEVPRLKDSP